MSMVGHVVKKAREIAPQSSAKVLEWREQASDFWDSSIDFSSELDELQLNPRIFACPPHEPVMHAVVCWQLAKRRAGTHKTKTVSEVSGSTRKIAPQKGSGNARHGGIRAHQFRHGAVAFGPRPRDYEHCLNKKVRSLGIRSALSVKFSIGHMLIVDDFKAGNPKTKSLMRTLAALGISNQLGSTIPSHIKDMSHANSVLLVTPNQIEASQDINNLRRSCANLHKINLIPVCGLNVYDILRHDVLVLSVESVKQIEFRLS